MRAAFQGYFARGACYALRHPVDGWVCRLKSLLGSLLSQVPSPKYMSGMQEGHRKRKKSRGGGCDFGRHLDTRVKGSVCPVSEVLSFLSNLIGSARGLMKLSLNCWRGPSNENLMIKEIGFQAKGLVKVPYNRFAICQLLDTNLPGKKGRHSPYGHIGMTPSLRLTLCISLQDMFKGHPSQQCWIVH